MASTKPFNNLTSGAHLRIVAASSAVNRTALEKGVDAISRLGFEVSLGGRVFDRWQEGLHLAGDDRVRAEDFMAALLDSRVDGVVMARGGYGAIRILPYLDPQMVALAPHKPVVGFSDVTALHQFLFYCGWPSIHGPNAHSGWDGESGAMATALLRGESDVVTETPLQQIAGPDGRGLVAPWRGGNLAVIQSMIGTPWEPQWEGSVLYLEEIHEKPYRIDRMLQQLHLSGLLMKVRGLVFGDAVFDDVDTDVNVVKKIVADVAQRAHIPAWWGIASGHREPMISLPLGIPLEITGKGVRIVRDARP